MRIKRKIIIGFLALFLFVSSTYTQQLPIAEPEDAGMSSTRLNQLQEIITKAIDNRGFPGAVILVARKGKIVFKKAFGESEWVPEHKPLNTSMIFDLASITKPVATATSIMVLVEQGKISLWEKVKDYVPEFAPYSDENGKPGVEARLWHLLTHTSGLPPYTDAEEVKKKYGAPTPLDLLVKHIAQLKKSDPAGKTFQYSCLGYITLAYILKKITNQTIAEFSEEKIFKPLNMRNTFFQPQEKFLPLCVPTEVVNGNPFIGIVHDPLARLQGGISGNAGLFSTADDLAIFAQMLLNKGEFNGVRILSPLTVERMTAVYPEASFSGRGLGWDIHSSYATVGGDIFGSKSYGHTGYTGTSIWIDPETETFVIFLTNRVHPDDKASIVNMRSSISNIVASSITKK